ncbi:hypothetical protein [Pseudofrankia inefficax]|uniref:Uncharacterized protein n=1 Tax=Pseudofrankia inefficax (strain DSM 45817 / CECT 9037 / DDB 130130 / EuI1c) TaxID=298654 RepID=E3J748_PSEI1|nr:hypothetical protein [Pseudofrankia inefficax]ADP84412.1 hypothetical protein FraEuI1c_6431 [Pseudofrankia inefficax]
MATPRKPAKPARRYLPEGTISPTTPGGLPGTARPSSLAVVANAAQAGSPVSRTRGATAQGDGGLAVLGSAQGLTQVDRNALVNGAANGTFLPAGTTSTPRPAPRSSTRRRGR